MPNSVSIGSLKAEPGTRNFGMAKVSETATYDVDIPVMIVNGKRDGPTLCLTGGTHPVEYPGIEAVIRIANKLDPNTLRGTLIGIPIMNVPGFQAKSPDCPLDNTNLNRIFPGKPEGSAGPAIADFVTKEVLSKATYYVDCHGANLGEVSPNHMICYEVGKKKVDEDALSICKCFDTEYVRVYKPAKTEMQARSPLLEASLKDIPSALTEAGSVGGLSSTTGMLEENDVTWLCDGITNVMRHFGMLDGHAKLASPKIITEWVELRAPCGGLFYLTTRIGTRVQKGQVVGEIRDCFGQTRATLKAPFEGLVSLVQYHLAVDRGRHLVQLFNLETARS